MGPLVKAPIGLAKYMLLLMAVIGLFAVACSSASAPAEPASEPAAKVEMTGITPIPSQATAAPAESAAPTAAEAPKAAAEQAPAPAAVTSTKDTLTLVTNGEPDLLGAWSQGCSGNVPSLVCEDLASDPLTWIDSTTFEVVPLTGVEKWEQIDPDRWRFYLREGVTFHNGEAWNADAAKLGIDMHGDKETNGHGTGSFGFHGVISGEVVDDMTVDVVCEVACPILPRTTIFLKFQAPEWWAATEEGTRDRTTVGNGPYKVVEWRVGQEVELEAFEDYKPNDAFDSQAPAIKQVFQVWRDEEIVRASMIATGEADLAFEIGFENIDRVPRAIAGTNNEVYTLVADNIWHPELKKKKVRQALALAIDCQAIVDNLYNGLQDCYGNISQTGTVGITPENSKGYGYDLAKAKQLLEEAGYDSDNEIRIHSRQGRVFRDVELWESVVSMWSEIGVNASLQILEPSKAREARRSGCGQYKGDDALNCSDQEPPPPMHASSHYYETATSNESLDMQRQLLLRNSCFNVNSRVCNNVPGFQDMIEEAIATPLGDQRTARMENLATIIHDEYWFLPMFQVVTVYGLADDLEWTPRYDPRTRVNTMSFK